jgi:3-methyladenine DNA glycosylase AlkC
MAEPLKTMYNRQFVAEFSTKLQRVYSAFDAKRFAWRVFDSSWERRELKDRMHHITESLRAELPPEYPEALQMLCALAPECEGFPYLIFPDFVELYGCSPEHEERSLQALELFTQYSSAEFAIRPFIKRNPERVMAQMLAWTQHRNHHVRRLASEGCRPRLPWAVALAEFQRNPQPILPIVEQLKADESDYVRRSVANNLNDIAKDHPDVVLELAERWKGIHPHTDWIIKHGCRTLFKRGNAKALALVGVAATNAVRVQNFQALQPRLHLGDTLTYTFELVVTNGEPQRTRIDLAVDYVKANGSTSKKVFKLLEKTVASGVHVVRRTLRFQDFTTRKHYAGNHRLALVVNGVEAAETAVVLEDNVRRMNGRMDNDE